MDKTALALTAIAFFDKAATKLKWPRIKLVHPELGRVNLVRTGPNSGLGEGAINVVNDQQYPNNKHYFAITKQGRIRTGKAHEQAVEDFVFAFLEHPAHAAALHGKQHSWCCFCGSELTDARSMLVGYGPICAGKWDLPWGETPAPTSLPEV